MLEKPKKTVENLPVDGDVEDEPTDQDVLTRRVVNDKLRRKVQCWTMSSCFYPKCQTNGTDYPSAAAGLAPTVATATADNQPLDVRWWYRSCWARTKEGRRPKPGPEQSRRGEDQSRPGRNGKAPGTARGQSQDHGSRRISRQSGIAKRVETQILPTYEKTTHRQSTNANGK